MSEISDSPIAVLSEFFPKGFSRSSEVIGPRRVSMEISKICVPSASELGLSKHNVRSRNRACFSI